jgi:prepilin-type N-terminal cleavage/methylation domain-containing protein
VTRRAFTLLELVLVLAVLGMVASVVASRLALLRGSREAEVVARRFAEQVLRAQRLSASAAQPVRLHFDPAQPACSLAVLRDGVETAPGDGHDAAVTLRGSQVDLACAWVGADTSAAPGAVDLLFTPDARCQSAGTATFSGGGRRVSVTVAEGSRPPLVEVLHDAP